MRLGSIGESPVETGLLILWRVCEVVPEPRGLLEAAVRTALDGAGSKELSN